MENRLIDEMLELIWTEKERDRNSHDSLIANVDFVDQKESPMAVGEILQSMVQDGLITIDNKTVVLTDAGKNKAKNIIRRHRLSEVLFTDVFNAKESIMENSSCSMEHILNKEVTDKICTFLGHPPYCPHGKEIPRGECCSVYHTYVEPLVKSLAKAEMGKNFQIVFINSKDHSQTDRLLAFGVMPGKSLYLHQKAPSYIIKIGQTELAIDKEIAQNIYVKQKVE